jgi:hypothetical protein
MLIQRPNIRIVSREVTLKSGERALAYFAVREVFGVLECKFLGTKVIGAPKAETGAEILLLAAPVQTVWAETPIRTIYETFSPYFTLEFLTSQLARAPSRK